MYFPAGLVEAIRTLMGMYGRRKDIKDPSQYVPLSRGVPQFEDICPASGECTLVGTVDEGGFDAVLLRASLGSTILK